MNNMTDSELLARYVNTDDQSAFRELHDRHSADVLRYLIRRVNAEDARDLLQEVFICVWKLHDTYKPGANVGAWLQTIAKNRVKNHWRDENRVRRCPTGATVGLSMARNVASPDTNENINRKNIMTPAQIKRVMKHHEIPACWHKAFCVLVIHGTFHGNHKFSKLTREDPEFKACLNMCLDILSAPFVRLFGDVPNKRAIAMAGPQ